jgi:hypothetical protein
MFDGRPAASAILCRVWWNDWLVHGRAITSRTIISGPDALQEGGEPLVGEHGGLGGMAAKRLCPSRATEQVPLQLPLDEILE